MKKIVIAVDSFKGCMNSKDICKTIADELENEYEVVSCPIADGGEGTLDILVANSNKIEVNVLNPYFKEIITEYGFKDDIAIIESAKASGINLVNKEELELSKATTYGVGQLILDAFNKGFKKFILTVGGTATNDGGCGLFCAIGAKFTNYKNEEFIPTAKTLKDIKNIDISNINKDLFDCEFTILTDVKNKLTGLKGATFVYGKQKGATLFELLKFEQGMKHYAKKINKISNQNILNIKGLGAGGGISTPLITFFNAKIVSGIDYILDFIEFDKKINNAFAVITGEGKIDKQSLNGKVISGICNRANIKNIPIYCIAGICENKNLIKSKLNIKEILCLNELALSNEDSIYNAEKYLSLKSKELKVLLEF